jgi:hypothetical protein
MEENNKVKCGIPVKIDTPELDAALEKARRLKELLAESAEIINSFNNTEIKFNVVY